MIRITQYIIITLGMAMLFSCYEDDISFKPTKENIILASETNVQALVRSLRPDALPFDYDNKRPKPLDLIKFNLNYSDGIQFDLTPLLFNDINGDVYRDLVTVSIEHMIIPEHYLKRGMNTQLRDQTLLDLDISIRIIFTDKAGYRLNLRKGLEMELLSKSSFDADNIYTLDEPNAALPYGWKEHPMADNMNLTTSNITIDGEELIKYNFTMLDNQWISFGRESELISESELCIDYVQEDISLLDSDKTLAFAVMNTEIRQIVQLHLDDELAFCTQSYPTENVSKIIIYSMEEYLDRYYYEKFYDDFSNNDITIQKNAIDLETMIDKLSSI